MNSAKIRQPFLLFWFLISSVTPGYAFPVADSIQESREASVKAFLGEEVEFDRYVFQPGQFPHVRWKRPGDVRAEVGDIPLSVEYFDRSYERVAKAANLGRYGAVVRGATAEGFAIVRYVTLYCCDSYFEDYSPELPITMESLPGFGISDNRWELYRQHRRTFSFGSLLTFPVHDPDAAVFLAGLSEIDASNALETPRIVDRQWWIEFKRRNETSIRRPIPFPEPSIDPTASSLIDAPNDFSTAYSGADLERIRHICASWSDSSHEPIVALVSIEGRVVFHEAFGFRSDGSPMTTETRTWMASITKLLTGFLVMRFVDNGSLDLDAPIDKYLPELRTGQDCPLTLRNLLTHTSGLAWVGEWASDWNPSIENEVAQALPFVHPGRTFRYHRAGYAVAGKVLERLTGRAVPYLFDQLVFQPLGMNQAFADNTYGGLYATALDMAKFGQMLLNHGRYAGVRLLSEQSWTNMMPKPLHLESGNQRWGIGTSPLGGDGFSDRTFGHEAASGALFRIDPVYNMVVLLGRNGVGPDYAQYKRFSSRFLQAVTSPLQNHGE